MKKLFILFISVVAMNISICTPGFSHADGENPTRIDDSPGGRMPGSAITQGDWLSVAPAQILKIDKFIEDKNNEIQKISEEGAREMKAIGSYQQDLKTMLENSALARLNDTQRADMRKTLSQLNDYVAKDSVPDKTEWNRLCENLKKYDAEFAGVIKSFYDVVYSGGRVILPQIEKFLADLIVGKEMAIGDIQRVQSLIAELSSSVESKYSQVLLFRNDLSEYQNAQKYGMEQLENFMIENPLAIQSYLQEQGDNTPNVKNLQLLVAKIKASKILAISNHHKNAP